MYACVCSESGRERGVNGQYEKPTTVTTPRSKCWPPSYCDPPPLIITDYGICRATTPIKHPDPKLPSTTTEDPGQDPCDVLCLRETPSVTLTVTVTCSDDDDLDDSHCRLLAPSSASSSSSSQHVDTVPTVTTTEDTVSPLCDT